MMAAKKLFLFPVLLVLFNTGCKMKQPIDTLVTHAKIYSVDSLNQVFEAMAVKDGKILELGTGSSLAEKYRADTIIDAQGRAIFPGFIDAHCHFYGMAQGLQFADLTGSDSFDGVLERIARADSLHGDGWVVGRGWDHNLWQSKEFPDNTKLNALYPNRPVMLIRIDGHVVLANQEALKRAGIGVKNIYSAGEVEMKMGKLTGILGENAADKMRSSVPPPDVLSMVALLRRAENLCLKAGLTCVGDAGLNKSEIMLIDTLQRAEKLSLNVYAMLSPTAENISYFVKHGPYETDRLVVRSLKLYADGSLGSRSALLKQPYNDDRLKTGILTTPVDTMQKICQIAIDRGYQVNTHCIGDSACRLVLDIYSRFLKGPNDRRWRIEHAQVVDPADFHLFKDNSVIPSVQATHATSDMYWAEKRIGPARIKGAYAYKDLLNQNSWIANGTDFPIEQISPLLTFYAAVSRKDLKGFPADGFQVENALTREEALRSITIWAARANFQEQKLGSLEPGKSADFIILDQDIMQIPITNIPTVKVLRTFIAGERVFSN